MKRPNVRHYVCFPGSPRRDMDEAESIGVLCNPLCAGYGPFRPVVADAEWIRAAIKIKRKFGFDQLLVNILFLLRANHQDPECQAQFDSVPPGDYSICASPIGHMPPTVAFASEVPTTEAELWGLACNPAYVGYGPFPALISDKNWIECSRLAVKEQGIEQYLVNLLYLLRCNHGRSVFSPLSSCASN